VRKGWVVVEPTKFLIPSFYVTKDNDPNKSKRTMNLYKCANKSQLIAIIVNALPKDQIR
jgi:hypothetical protein